MGVVCLEDVAAGAVGAYDELMRLPVAHVLCIAECKLTVEWCSLRSRQNEARGDPLVRPSPRPEGQVICVCHQDRAMNYTCGYGQVYGE